HSHPRAERLAAARVHVTARAPQAIADVVREALAGGNEQGASALDRGPEGAARDQGIGGTGQGGCRGGAAVWHRGTLTRAASQQREADQDDLHDCETVRPHAVPRPLWRGGDSTGARSEEHTSELQSR